MSAEPIFRRRTQRGQPGFKSVLKQIAEAWKKDREKIVTSSDRIVAELQRATEPGKGAPDRLEQGIRHKAYEQFADIFDEKLGGFGDAPKFPRPVILIFFTASMPRTPILRKAGTRSK